jgi:hypothetical protein
MKLAAGFIRRALLLGVFLVAISIVSALAGAAPSASAAKISARLTKTSFTSSQAGSVKLICKFKKKSGSFSYLLTVKKGKMWPTVKRVKKERYRKGSYTMTVKKVFAGKPVKLGSYRLKLSAGGGSKRLSFKVVKAASPAVVTPPVVTPPAGSKPVSTSPPLIIGTPTQGQTLTALNGSWNNSPTSYSAQWRSCDGSGSNCADIAGATGSAYVLVYADAGHTIRVTVTASNSNGSASTNSAQTAVVAGLLPANTALPAISGTATQGQTLSVSTGSWTNSPTAIAYQWRSCDGSGSSCSGIAGVTGNTYDLVYADAGRTIRVVVTASNSYGSTGATSAQTAPVIGLPPSKAPTFPPEISGTAKQGETLTVSTGLWLNATSFVYQWLRCTGPICHVIGVASPSNTYMLEAADVSHTILVVVTATNPYGSTAATSAQTAVVAGAPPVNTALPAISGDTWPVVGSTRLTASPGSWTNSPTGYTYQWQNCIYTCSDITGATLETYDVKNSDWGQTIRVVVTASNGTGPNPAAISNQTELVGRPPANGGVPTISGVPLTGETLTASTGIWTEFPTSFTYQWQTCNSSGGNCVDLGSASTSNTLTLNLRDMGPTVQVIVTAGNNYGSVSATSIAIVITSGAPVNVGLPAITGSPGVGQTLTASSGSWSPMASSYSYDWRRCTSEASCTSLGAPNLSTYVPQAADIGYTIRVVVTAYNSYGLGVATSARTGTVGNPPVNTVLPSISGTAQVGQSLTAAHGTWTNSPTGYSYQWRRCDSSGSSCVDKDNNLLQAADYQHTIRVVVTASNAYGPGAAATSAQTAVVAGTPPVNTYLPVITGNQFQGEPVTATDGSWNYSPTSFTYQWRRCDTGGNNCVDISYGIFFKTYGLQAEDVGYTIRVVVTAWNTYGSGSATSPQTGVIVHIG